mmetsp:Transcript_34161/g.71074  ORF Transcript_34161/g.71074 Transcript_34161/m.71074 type:complete len:92 (+) Transcript_34161:1076-1351(+)
MRTINPFGSSRRPTNESRQRNALNVVRPCQWLASVNCCCCPWLALCDARHFLCQPRDGSRLSNKNVADIMLGHATFSSNPKSEQDTPMASN